MAVSHFRAPTSRLSPPACRLLTPDQAYEFPQGVIVAINDSLLERNDRVVGDRYVFRTNLGAAFGDVAIPDAIDVLQLVASVEDIQGMHLQLRGVNKQSRTNELLMQLMITQHVTHVLT